MAGARPAVGRGLSLEAREAVRQAFELLAKYLAGDLDIGGATIRGGDTLRVQVKASGETVVISIDEPRPVITKQFGPLSFEGRLVRLEVARDQIVVVIDGLPDQAIELK